MRRRRQVAGLVATACLLAAMLPACGRGGYTVTATFADSGDLQSRGAVEVADLRVGSVGKITLTKDFRSEVTLHIDNGVRIPRSSQAVLRTTSLLGERFVELRPIGDATHGPFLANGDTVPNSAQQPELEIVADTAVKLLGAVSATDVQTIVATGAQAFGDRGPQLSALIADLNQLSGTLATRTTEIGNVIDNLDHATQTLAAGSADLSTLLTNLASTTTLLAKDRDQAVTALASLTHLAQAADYSLVKYRADLDREIRQVDAVTATVVSSLGDLQNLLDWLQRFSVDFPKGIFGNYGGIYLRVVPFILDPRSPR